MKNYLAGMLLIICTSVFGQAPSIIWSQTFGGSGNKIPPSKLLEGQEIIINPSGNNQCKLNVSQTISDNSSMRVLHGKKFTIAANLNIDKLAKCDVE